MMMQWGAYMSCEILMFVCNQVAKSREILMFVCLQKDAKQCCDATKLACTHCACFDLHNEYSQAMWHHSFVWHLFEVKQTSKSNET